jgi:hypothetical protein
MVTPSVGRRRRLAARYAYDTHRPMNGPDYKLRQHRYSEMRDEQLRGWNDLAALADHQKRENWLYRGVTRDDHQLVSKIGRGGARSMNVTYDEHMERQLQEEFKRQARPMIAPHAGNRP